MLSILDVAVDPLKNIQSDANVILIVSIIGAVVLVLTAVIVILLVNKKEKHIKK